MLFFTFPFYLVALYGSLNNNTNGSNVPTKTIPGYTADEQKLVDDGFKEVQVKYDVVHRAFAKATPRGFEMQTREHGKNADGVEYGASGMVAVNTNHDDPAGMIKSAGECLKEKVVHDKVVQMIKDSATTEKSN